MTISLRDLYAILREACIRKEIIYYSVVSTRYHRRTDEYHEPHGTWDQHLGELNRLAFAEVEVAISPIVTYKPNDNQSPGPPGHGMWGTPGVPPCPSGKAAQEAEWHRLVNLAHLQTWPETLPGL